MRQNKPIDEVKNYSYIHRWLGQAYGRADRCEMPDCRKRSSRYEWAKLKDKPYAKYRENFWRLCHSCHLLYDRGGLPSWNKGVEAKDHPRLQASLDKAHAAARGKTAWNRRITEVPCDWCGGPAMKRPSDRKHSRTGKLFCSRGCMYQSRRDHYLKLNEKKS